MVYRNKKGQPRERAMVAAYVLVKDFGAKQKDVAQVLGCKQPSISSWVKEVGLRKEIDGLQRELDDARGLVEILRSEIDSINLIDYNPELPEGIE